MINVRLCFCLLSAVSFVKTLDVKGRYGEDVSFECSNWKIWLVANSNDKYLCKSPCTDDKHIIIKSAFGETQHKDRIQLTNNGSGLFVKFTNLQTSDSGIYYCGVERLGLDTYMKVNLKVTEEETHREKTTSVTVPTTSTQFHIETSPMVSSSTSNVVRNVSVSQNTSSGINTPTSASQGPGSFSLIVLLVSVIVVIVIVTVLLWFLRKMVLKKLKKEQTQQAVNYEEIRFEDQQTMSRPAGISTPSNSAGGDSVYANCVYDQSRECDVIYTKVLAPSSTRGASAGRAKGAATNLQSDTVYTEPALKKNPLYSEVNQSGGGGNDGLYSLAQLPRGT